MKTKYIEFEKVKYEVKKGDYIRITKAWSYNILRIVTVSFNTGDNRTLFITNSDTCVKSIPVNDTQLLQIDLDSMEKRESIYKGLFGEHYYTDYIFSEAKNEN
jgi:hypothetical protein